MGLEWAFTAAAGLAGRAKTNEGVNALTYVCEMITADLPHPVRARREVRPNQLRVERRPARGGAPLLLNTRYTEPWRRQNESPRPHRSAN